METVYTTVTEVEQLKQCKLCKASPERAAAAVVIFLLALLASRQYTTTPGQLGSLSQRCVCGFVTLKPPLPTVLPEPSGQRAGGASGGVTLAGPGRHPRFPSLREGKRRRLRAQAGAARGERLQARVQNLGILLRARGTRAGRWRRGARHALRHRAPPHRHERRREARSPARALPPQRPRRGQGQPLPGGAEPCGFIFLLAVKNAGLRRPSSSSSSLRSRRAPGSRCLGRAERERRYSLGPARAAAGGGAAPSHPGEGAPKPSARPASRGGAPLPPAPGRSGGLGGREPRVAQGGQAGGPGFPRRGPGGGGAGRAVPGGGRWSGPGVMTRFLPSPAGVCGWSPQRRQLRAAAEQAGAGSRRAGGKEASEPASQPAAGLGRFAMLQ